MNISKLLLKYQIVIIVTLFAFVSFYSFYLSYNLSHSERFGDETAHMIGGNMILKGRRLYRDIQSNHQPLNYFFSTITEAFSRPSNLFLYISRQRLVIGLYAFFWQLLIFLIIGPFSLIFLALFEIGKPFMSGYKLLSESLSVYPIAFIFFVTIKLFLAGKSLSKIELFVFSVSAFISVFSLLPLWFIVIPCAFIIYRSLTSLKDKKLLIIPFLLFTLVMFIFVSPISLIKETIYYNFSYFLPNSGSSPPPITSMILLPFYSFIPPFNIVKIIIAILIIFLLMASYLYYKEKKMKRWFLLLMLVYLSNFFRANEPTLTNFHLLVWYGAFLVFTTSSIYYLFQKKKYQKLFYWYNLLSILIIFASLFVLDNPYLQKKDRQHEFYINYSESESYGQAIKIVKSKDNKLIVITNDPLIYWVSDVDIVTRVLEYHPWIYFIPEYKKELIDTFNTNPPAFVVNTGLGQDIPTEKTVLTQINNNYIRLIHTGEPSKLYITKEKYNKINNKQWQILNDMFYQKPI